MITLKNTIAVISQRAVGTIFAVALALGSVACSSQTPSNSSSASSSATEMSSSSATNVSVEEKEKSDNIERISAKLLVNDGEKEDTQYSYDLHLASDNATVLSAITTSGIDAVIEDSAYGKYISAINGKAAEGSSGWVYTINGNTVMESVDVCKLKDGDVVELSYTSM